MELRTVMYFLLLESQALAVSQMKIVSILSELPFAPGYRNVGPALDLAAKEAADRYKDYLNVTLVKKVWTLTGSVGCEDFDSAVMEPLAREYWEHQYNKTDSCMIVIESGKKDVVSSIAALS